MTEQEWLVCADPQQMLEFLRGKASDRKLRLFAVACCRRIASLLQQNASVLHAVETAELFADGSVGEEFRSTAAAAIADVAAPPHKSPEFEAAWYAIGSSAAAAALYAHQYACKALGEKAVLGTFSPAAIEDVTRYYKARTEERLRSAVRNAWLLKDIFGNPFRPVPFDSSWRTPTVTALATAVYEERRFDDLPVLADALEESGCMTADVLNHLRSPGPHVKGCSALDLVLAKE